VLNYSELYLLARKCLAWKPFTSITANIG